MKVEILPSLLAADFGNLAASARQAETAGADALHLDIMDAHFVPNLSMGPDVVAMARRVVSLPLNVHLMMTNPDCMVDAFAEAGATSILIHIEADCDVAATLGAIRARGIRPGITLNPATPAESIFEVMDRVDEVLCMTVNPGYGGQSFMDAVLPKIRCVRDEANTRGRDDLTILVDGGVDLATAPRCAAAGANAFVAGTFLYGAPDMAAQVDRLREVATEALQI